MKKYILLAMSLLFTGNFCFAAAEAELREQRVECMRTCMGNSYKVARACIHSYCKAYCYWVAASFLFGPVHDKHQDLCPQPSPCPQCPSLLVTQEEKPSNLWYQTVTITNDQVRILDKEYGYTDELGCPPLDEVRQINKFLGVIINFVVDNI